VGVASIDRVGARVCYTIGARGDLYRFEVDDDRFDVREIGQAIVEAAAEMVCAFAEAYHPQRIPFLQWLPAGGMDSGDTVPAHIGQIEAVRVTATGESESEPEDDDWMLAEKTTAANIKLWRENHNSIFEDTDGYYDLTNQTLEFTGGVAQVKIVAYEPLYAETVDESESEDEEAGNVGELQISDIWETCLHAGAIVRLAKLGVPAELIRHYSGEFTGCLSRIRQGLTSKAEIDQEQMAR
jgi:hypothetical protein